MTGVGDTTIGVDAVSVTGIVTFLNVAGNLSNSRIRSNDIIGIGTEKVKVLNVDEVDKDPDQPSSDRFQKTEHALVKKKAIIKLRM